MILSMLKLSAHLELLNVSLSFKLRKDFFTALVWTKLPTKGFRVVCLLQWRLTDVFAFISLMSMEMFKWLQMLICSTYIHTTTRKSVICVSQNLCWERRNCTSTSLFSPNSFATHTYISTEHIILLSPNEVLRRRWTLPFTFNERAVSASMLWYRITLLIMLKLSRTPRW